MIITIFGGTTEGRNLAIELASLNHQVIVSVATDYGAEVMGEYDNITISPGRKNASEMKRLFAESDFVVDATHPYAKDVTKEIKKACEESGKSYYRLLRPKSKLNKSVIRFETKEEAFEYLKEKKGNILLTTGSKELPFYAELGPERLYPRVLPMIDSLQICESCNIPKNNILAIQGPFSMQLNCAMIQEYAIDFLVSKDGGIAGGFPDKMDACERMQIPLILIDRTDEDGYQFDEILNICR